MRYYSLNGQSPAVSFKEAVVLGQAPDKGLYFPEQVPLLPASFWESIRETGDEEIAWRILSPYVGGDLTEAALRKVIAETLNFPLPVRQVSEHISVLELFHGPTLAFKDIGARFMSRCLAHFAEGLQRRVVVLVATSGDTGGAVANSFFGVPLTDVVVLYP
ncbi:MAG: threonine synthase, partial [Sphingobacteriales bacterium]